MLGVAELKGNSEEGAGKLIADASYKFLEDWQCSDCIQTMVFDTTCSNTGHLSAGCIAVQEKLNRPLLWCACRHHIGELLLSHLWNDLKVEISSGPNICIFTRFRVNFKKLSINDISNFNYAPQSPENADIINLCKKVLKSQDKMRGDYRELAQLVIMFLDGGNTIYNIQAPGALHRARWMAKIIYSIKIIILSSKIKEELPKWAIFLRNQEVKLTRFVTFIVCTYVPWWYTAIFPEDAPTNDLILWKKIYAYPDKIVSQSLQKSFSNHTWYMTEELILLSLFSDKVTLEEKEKMVEKLKCFKRVNGFQNRHGTGFGKPVLPQIKENKLNLSEYVGASSWYFFTMLGIETEFLNLPVDEWKAAPSYILACDIIKNIRTVNDMAERGVKLASDFISAAKIESRYQNVLQVVENERVRLPNQRKRKT